MISDCQQALQGSAAPRRAVRALILSVRQTHRYGADDEQPSQPQAVNKMVGSNSRERQLDMPWEPPSPRNGIPENGGNLRIRQLVAGYLERHEPEDSWKAE
jgi:hypothetical protein